MQGNISRLLAAAAVGMKVCNGLELKNEQLSDRQVADLLR